MISKSETIYTGHYYQFCFLASLQLAYIANVFALETSRVCGKENFHIFKLLFDGPNANGLSLSHDTKYEVNYITHKMKMTILFSIIQFSAMILQCTSDLHIHLIR